MPPRTARRDRTAPRRTAKPSQPSAEERRLIARVASEAKINTVLLHELHCTRVDALPKNAVLKTNFNVQARHWVEAADDRHHLKVMVRVHATTEPAAHEVIAVLLAVYEVGPTITNENALPFAKYNAVFNCWPYWRELYQSVSGRMGIPAPMSPLLMM